VRLEQGTACVYACSKAVLPEIHASTLGRQLLHSKNLQHGWMVSYRPYANIVAAYWGESFALLAAGIVGWVLDTCCVLVGADCLPMLLAACSCFDRLAG
jgi:hypothetical protein